MCKGVDKVCFGTWDGIAWLPLFPVTLTFNFHPWSLRVTLGLDRKCLGWEGESRAEISMGFNRHNGWRMREGRVVKLPVGVLRLNHTYFKANSRSFIQLPGFN